MFLRESVGIVISKILFFVNSLKKFSCPVSICRVALFFSRSANILYERTHINLTFHTLSPRRSNTAFARHYIAKNVWWNMTLFFFCHKRREADLPLLEHSISTLANEWHAVNFRNDAKGEAFFEDWTRSQREAHASLILNKTYFK